MLTFIGAARTVTGSLYLVEHDRQKFLLECGLYQGHREEAERINRTFPFKPREIKAVILSHAHLDHSGNLPSLVKRGFDGPVYCTPATADIASLLLMDSARLQESDIAYFNKKQAQHNLPLKEPLYTAADAEAAIRAFVSVNYQTAFEPVTGVWASLYDAGHILGSSQIVIELGKIRVLFSGDLGRKNMPIIRDPARVSDIDYLILESTYGSRLHTSFDEMTGELRDMINEGIARRSKIIIPAFAVERTQMLITMLKDLSTQGTIKDVPVYIDSPLATDVTEVFKRHPECFDEETYRIFERDDPFNFPGLRYIHDTEDSKRLNAMHGPMIVISASGMCEGGRILHHLIHSISDPNTVIIITGFQARGTLGRKILEGARTVQIFNESYTVNAKIHYMSGLSAHGDSRDLLEYVRALNGPRLKCVYLVHGDIEESVPLKQKIEELGIKAEIPQTMQQVAI
jgi:metallo-beta-lactamase family protein